MSCTIEEMALRRAATALATLAIAGNLSCSFFLQRSVRSSSVYCSTTPGYWIADVAIAAGGVTGLAIAGTDKPLVYSPAALFVGSAVIGILERRSCIRHRASAPPEVWAAAAVAERARREEVAREGEEWRRQESERWQQERVQQRSERAAKPTPNRPSNQRSSTEQPAAAPPAPPPPPQPPAPSAPSPPPAPPPPPPGRTTIVIHHAAADEVGKTCKWTEGEYPTAHECQYGAVCYRDRCTTWCGPDNACPAGTHCGEADVGLRVGGLCLP